MPKRRRPRQRGAGQRSLEEFFSVRHADLPETDSEMESEPSAPGSESSHRPPPAPSSPMEATGVSDSQETHAASSQEEACDQSSDEEWSPSRHKTCPQTTGKTIYLYYLVQIDRVEIQISSVQVVAICCF